MSNARLRFAPSPTGPLHIGGLRTALYNYLIAKNLNGKFILRIEDTDLNRFNKNAEEHIINSIRWAGLDPDESPQKPGKFGPYRQSERKEIYQKYIEVLIKEKKAYYAFDNIEELEKLRKSAEKKGETFIYNWENREKLKNSLSLNEQETKSLIDNGNYVIRFNVYPNNSTNEQIRIEDEIRGKITVDRKLLDDKIIFKSDGMPTYHLANIVDDHLMSISHVVRGEEWLPSLPLHYLLYDAFGWEKPIFAHLPLILKPTGKGKLSKRDGELFGIPIYPISWIEDEKLSYKGFKEIGFEKQAFLNFICMIGWNPGTADEIFEIHELIKIFDIKRIIKSGGKYDFEKAKWFNKEHIKKIGNDKLINKFQTKILDKNNEIIDSSKINILIELARERIEFRGKLLIEIDNILSYNLKEFKENIKKIELNSRLIELIKSFLNILEKKNSNDKLKEEYISKINKLDIKIGEGMRTLRLFLTGKTNGADLFKIISVMKKEVIIKRLNQSLITLND